MTVTLALGYAARLGTGSTATVDQAFEFASESIQRKTTHVVREGITGSRGVYATDVRNGTYSVGGSLVLEPTPEDLAIWFPRILGATAVGTTYSMAETLPDFYLSVDRIQKVFTYAGMKVNRATFSCGPSRMLRLSLDLVGKTESVANAGTFPSLTPSMTTPYIFSECVLTLVSTAYLIPEFELIFDNGLITDRYMNSQTVGTIPDGPRSVTLRVTPPYQSDYTALYDMAIAGVAGTLVFTNGGYSTTFAFTKLQAPAESPTVPSRAAELALPLELTARRDGSTAEVVVTHDSTA